MGQQNPGFRAALERAVVVVKVKPTWFDVVLRQGGEPDVRLGTFFEAEVAETHRTAVIDGVLAAHQEKAA